MHCQQEEFENAVHGPQQAVHEQVEAAAALATSRTAAQKLLPDSETFKIMLRQISVISSEDYFH